MQKKEKELNINLLKKYDEVGEFFEGFAKVRVGELWGFINENGEELCEIRYEEVRDFNNNLAFIRKEGKVCYLNNKGEEVKVNNFLGKEMIFDGCKSCAIGNKEITNLPGGYLFNNGVVNLTIDPEIPIKGFMVIGVNRHLASTTQFSKKERLEVEELTNWTKLGLESLGIKNILLFEDGFSEHYRRWIIAVSDWMFQFGRGKNLKDITKYAKKTATEKDIEEIMNFTEKMKSFFQKNNILK